MKNYQKVFSILLVFIFGFLNVYTLPGMGYTTVINRGEQFPNGQWTYGFTVFNSTGIKNYYLSEINDNATIDYAYLTLGGEIYYNEVNIYEYNINSREQDTPKYLQLPSSLINDSVEINQVFYRKTSGLPNGLDVFLIIFRSKDDFKSFGMFLTFNSGKLIDNRTIEGIIYSDGNNAFQIDLVSPVFFFVQTTNKSLGLFSIDNQSGFQQQYYGNLTNSASLVDVKIKNKEVFALYSDLKNETSLVSSELLQFHYNSGNRFSFTRQIHIVDNIKFFDITGDNSGLWVFSEENLSIKHYSIIDMTYDYSWSSQIIPIAFSLVDDIELLILDRNQSMLKVFDLQYIPLRLEPKESFLVDTYQASSSHIESIRGTTINDEPYYTVIGRINNNLAFSFNYFQIPPNFFFTSTVSVYSTTSDEALSDSPFPIVPVVFILSLGLFLLFNKIRSKKSSVKPAKILQPVEYAAKYETQEQREVEGTTQVAIKTGLLSKQICSACNGSLEEDAVFCKFCGNKIPKDFQT